jgi:hypothetical protein
MIVAQRINGSIGYMDTLRFKLYLPRPNMFGNLIWQLPQDQQEAEELHAFFEAIKSTGIWCSCFPDGDGFCFAPDAEGRLDNASLTPEYYSKATQLFKEVFGQELQVITFAPTS